MKTVEIKLYKFEELSESAKKAAIEDFRAAEYEGGFVWSKDYIDSMKAFAEFFDIELKDWSVGGRGEGVYFQLKDEMSELEGVRLWKYLNNNYLNIKNKYGDKVLDGQCYFTGYCGDEDLLDAIRQFMKNPKGSAEQLFEECFANWIKAYNADADYQFSDEGITETIEINDYDFTEDGKLY